MFMHEDSVDVGAPPSAPTYGFAHTPYSVGIVHTTWHVSYAEDELHMMCADPQHMVSSAFEDTMY